MAKAKRKKPTKRRRSATEAALASLAHEIRTPLTGILALAELLHASDLPEREQRWAEAIRGAADHLARLTELVVDAAKPDAAGLFLWDITPEDLAWRTILTAEHCLACTAGCGSSCTGAVTLRT